MEFIHISDVHYKMALTIGSAKDIEDSLLSVVDVCNERQSELLLISGDLFHTIPSLGQLREMDYIFKKLVYTKVIIIAGNHDYIVAGGAYDSFEFESNTYVFKPGQERLNGSEIGINADVYGVSYEGINMEDKKDLAYFEENFVLDEGKVNILLLHGGTKNQLDINFKEFACSKFDYVALGHIHKPQIISENAAYAGSLFPLDRTEMGEHGYIIGRIDEMSAYAGRRTSLEFVPSAKVKYEEITVELNEYMTLLV